MATPDDQIPGQIDIWGAIEIAESGSDGRSTSTPGTAPQKQPDGVPVDQDPENGTDANPGAPTLTQRLSVAQVVRRRMEGR